MENKFIENYIEWIRKNVFIKSIGKNKWLIETPFLDRHNDYLEIYILKEGNNYHLTDDGFIFSDLKASGFDLSTDKRKDLFKTALVGLGINFNKKTKEIFIDTDLASIGKSKHNLVQAMLTIGDMFVLADSTVSTLFKEDVKKYFKRKDIPFNYDVRIRGRSSYEHNIEIALPIMKNKPETFIKIVNNPIKNNAEHAIFILNDIKEMRKNTKSIVIFNDSNKVGKGFIDALNAYRIESIPWSKKDDYTKQFVFEYTKD
jgi:hypothetical protein